MSNDPYSPCPCGSGKKFKWCCQAIYSGIERAFRQFENGQAEMALRTMDEVTSANPRNPEAHGQRAVLLFEMKRYEDAEKAIDDALQINPKYAFGLFLLGQFRMAERRTDEALTLFRQAVDAYDTNVPAKVAQVCSFIAEIEMQHNRPLAAHAAIDIAVRLQPNVAEMRELRDKLFGPETHLPSCAAKAYEYREAPADLADDKRKIWQTALKQQTTGRLEDAAKAFGAITEELPEVAAGWYNLVLTRAWQGDSAGAVEVLDEYFGRESDPAAVAEASALAEVLRCARGVDPAESDYLEYARVFEIKDGQAFSNKLNEFGRSGRMVAAQVDEQTQTFVAVLTEAPTVLTAAGSSDAPPRFAADFVLMGQMMRIACTSEKTLATITSEMEQVFGETLGESESAVGPLRFAAITNPALVYPLVESEEDEKRAEEQLSAGMAEYYEQTWIHGALHSLRGSPPIDAAGHPQLRPRLEGVIQFLADCAGRVGLPYDFDRLRRKLGLIGGPAESGSTDSRNFDAMSAAELSTVDGDALSYVELESASRAAKRLDAQELNAAFLKKLVTKPYEQDNTDRFAPYRSLIERSMGENSLDEALEFVDAGEKADCEHNEGRRRNDFELERGRVHAKRGETDEARDAFQRLIERSPEEPRYRGTAAEAMLSAGDKAHAQKFAEGGLELARKQQDRDSEQYFLELSEAAQRK